MVANHPQGLALGEADKVFQGRAGGKNPFQDGLHNLLVPVKKENVRHGFDQDKIILEDKKERLHLFGGFLGLQSERCEIQPA